MGHEPDAVNKGRIANMSFKMPREWHRRFKLRAFKEGISMTELLKKCFAFYIRHNPL